MKRKESLQDPKILSTLLWGSSLVTLFLWTNLTDPFNAPKSWVLYLFGAYLFGWIIFQIPSNFASSRTRIPLLIICSFSLSLFVAFIKTDVNFVGLFGENARRTGFLTYFFWAYSF